MSNFVMQVINEMQLHHIHRVRMTECQREENQQIFQGYFIREHMHMHMFAHMYMLPRICTQMEPTMTA